MIKRRSESTSTVASISMSIMASAGDTYMPMDDGLSRTGIDHHNGLI